MSAAIIIGASSGIGREIARIYIGRGYRVGVAARRIDCLSGLVEMAPQRVVAHKIDITAEDATVSLGNLIANLGEVPTLFINCAGIGYANPQLEAERDLATVNTNCMGFTRVIDFMFNYYADNGIAGQIASISSIAGTKGIGIAASYSASKRFQSEYLTALAQLAHQRRLPIAITDIKPGFADTPLLDSSTKYPMMMNPTRVAALTVKAIDRKKRSRIIDRRWAVITGIWKCIPTWIWRHIRLSLKTTK